MKQLLWAPVGFEKDLEHELERKHVQILNRQVGLFLIESLRNDFVWVQARGEKAEILEFNSITQAQTLLRERSKLWTEAPVTSFRRSELILQGLLTPKKRKRKFLEALPQGRLGSFTLVSDNEMWITPELKPATPLAMQEFAEDPEAPSRAYLKLWELFTREGFKPRAGDKCLELGSAPGGWTWVLANLGCQVTAVDKGEMDPKVLAKARVHWLKKDAFSLEPNDFEPLDWFFSDLICYPARLLETVLKWEASGRVQNFVCTIKFQGETDFHTLDEFLKIPGSKALHLHHNKHELTWIRIKNSGTSSAADSDAEAPGTSPD